MPKGVYARKSAQAKAKGRVKAKAKAAPVRKPAPAVQLQALAVTPAVQLAEPAPVTYSKQDFRRSIDDMPPPMLKAYARTIGIQQRDVDGLTEDRLRQNCKARVLASIED